MPWAWVAVGLVLWMVAVLLVIALCTYVRKLDARLGRDRQGARGAMEHGPRPGGGVEVE
jgi:hypothetical protein